MFDPESFINLIRSNQERDRYLQWNAARHSSTEAAPGRIRTVGVIGGGTAGYFAALGLRAQLPHLEITLVESSDIPVIGVGEASTPHLIPFLHGDLGLDIVEMYEEVHPTWKYGIHFDWGLPGDYHFQAPFDWNANNVGTLGSIAYEGNINSMTLQSIMMERGVTGILKHPDGQLTSLMTSLPYAYHLDNRRFVKYLHKKAIQRGVKHLDRKIDEVVLSADGGEIDHLVTQEGERLQYDLYIDCTGFRSMLLGKKLQAPFISYADSLFTDRAVIFNVPHGGKIKPYTSAISMHSGWMWNIPQEDEDHCGYVFSSPFCTFEEAEREARERFPAMKDPHGTVHFRSGRHEDAWRGNVIAIGNAYGFVEPLESTGLMMIVSSVRTLCRLWPRSPREPGTATLYNLELGQTWDSLRWFLSVHYKFNRKFDTPFWQAAREKTDVSGAAPVLDAFRELAPLNLRGPATAGALRFAIHSAFHGALIGGYDCLLLGQQVPCRLGERLEDEATWRRRKDAVLACLEDALPTAEALQTVREHPEMLYELIRSPKSWLRMFQKGTFWPNASDLDRQQGDD